MALQIDELGRASIAAVLRQASVMGTRFTRAGLVAALELDEDARRGDPRAPRGLPHRRRRRRTARSVTGCCAMPPTTGCRSADGAPCTAESANRSSSAPTPTSGGRRRRSDAPLLRGRASGRSRSATASSPARKRARSTPTTTRRPCSSAPSPPARSWRGARPEAVMRAAEALGDVRLSLGELERARAAFATRPAPRAGRRGRARAAVAQGGQRRLPARRVCPRPSASCWPRWTCSTNLSSIPATAQRARIESLLGIVTLWRGHPRESVEWLKRAIADAESVDAKKALAHALAGLDLAYNDLGDSQRAIHSARALEIYEELGDLVSQGGDAQQPRHDRVLRGTLERGARPLRQGPRGLGSGGRHAQRVDGELQHRRDPLGTGQARRGRAAAARGRAIQPRGRRGHGHRGVAAGDGASWTPAAETTSRALAQLEEARRLLEASGDASATLLADARLAEVLDLGGEYDRAAELAARTLERQPSDEESVALLLPVLHRVLGHAHLLAGRLDAAREALELAIAEANRVEHRYEEALALAALSRLDGALERGRARAGTPLRAARHRRAARRLGAAGDATQEGGRSRPPSRAHAVA